MRLKPHAIDLRATINPIHWFLGSRNDTRSSYYLEDAATEFQVQGLEVDWACVSWDADLRRTGNRWSFHSFRGDVGNGASHFANRSLAGTCQAAGTVSVLSTSTIQSVDFA